MIIKSVDLLSEGHLGGLVVDLGELLHLQVMLTNQVLLLLGQVSEVSGWSSSVDLSTLNSHALSEVGTCCQDTEALNSAALGNGSTVSVYQVTI